MSVLETTSGRVLVIEARMQHQHGTLAVDKKKRAANLSRQGLLIVWVLHVFELELGAFWWIGKVRWPGFVLKKQLTHQRCLSAGHGIVTTEMPELTSCSHAVASEASDGKSSGLIHVVGIFRQDDCSSRDCFTQHARRRHAFTTGSSHASRDRYPKKKPRPGSSTKGTAAPGRGTRHSKRPFSRATLSDASKLLTLFGVDHEQ